jgi:hypothetical protein
MTRTIEDVTVRRDRYDSHDQLRGYLNDLIAAYNFARRLKHLRGPTPYEFICKPRPVTPPLHRHPHQQIAGLNT